MFKSLCTGAYLPLLVGLGTADHDVTETMCQNLLHQNISLGEGI